MERRATVRWTDPDTGAEFTQEAERLIDAARLLDDVIFAIVEKRKAARKTAEKPDAEPTARRVPYTHTAIIWRSSDAADQSRYLQFIDYSTKPHRAAAKVYEITASMRSTGPDDVGPMILVVDGTLYVVTRCDFAADGVVTTGSQGVGREVAVVDLVKYRSGQS